MSGRPPKGFAAFCGWADRPGRVCYASRMKAHDRGISVTGVVSVTSGHRSGDAPRARRRRDRLTVEEPLEIRLNGRSLTVVMRTPGNDLELAAGLLWTEGIVRDASEIGAIGSCEDPREPDRSNIVSVTLAPGVGVDWKRLKRSFFATASCGLCGKTAISALRQAAAALPAMDWTISPATLLRLPARMRRGQAAFRATGGLHAAGLFASDGRLVLLREDVGRHNAVDKVIGAALEGGLLPAGRTLLLVSGRASFEIVQKAWMAGIPMLAAVSAPSTLAVETSREAGMTLVGFLRDGGFNLYCGGERVDAGAASARPVAARRRRRTPSRHGLRGRRGRA